jgi:hypothetical protein
MKSIHWQYPCSAAIAALVVYLPMLVSRGFDFWLLLYLFILLPILTLLLGLILLVIGLVKHRAPNRAMVAMTLIYWAVSVALFMNVSRLRPTLRWLLWSKEFKTTVLLQPNMQGQLKHAEWDGWGGFGSDTTAYLVYDPTNSLADVARKKVPGKFSGIPCEVPPIRRLESQWYSVVFYTNEGWPQGANENCQ